MNFNDNGDLTPGIHPMTWKEFYDSFSFSVRRKELLEGLEKVVTILREIGATHIYIDGSFVTSKLEPGDWDACFKSSIPILKNFQSKFPLYDNREAQKELYKGEVFFAYDEADGFGHTFLEFFQQKGKKSAIKKGIRELID